MCKQIHDFILSRLLMLLCNSGRDWRRTFSRFFPRCLRPVSIRPEAKWTGSVVTGSIGVSFGAKMVRANRLAGKPVLDFSLRGFQVTLTRTIFAFAVFLKDYSSFSVKVNCNRSLRIVAKQCTLGKDG